MKVRLIDSPAEFLETALPFLGADEARHNLILGLASTLDEFETALGTDLSLSPTRSHLYVDHRLWLVENAGNVVGAALRTPPRGLVLGRPATDEALLALVDAIDDDLPGVVGARPEVEVFSDLWARKTGTTPHVKVEHGIYSLSTVESVPKPDGRSRLATPHDRPLLVEWWKEFAIEAVHDDMPDLDDIARSVDYRLEVETALGTDLSLSPTRSHRGFLLWEDSEIVVSLAGYGGRTPNGIRIGPVYTPPEQRGRGYASALVAALSAERLDAGNRFCFLYTDLANATSNAIYRRIGYEQVCESAEIEFSPTTQNGAIHG